MRLFVSALLLLAGSVLRAAEPPTPAAERFAGLESRELTGIDRVMFFANYYAGLHEDLLGHPARALELLHAAVANRWGRTAETGPAYMWQVARLHYEKLATAKR